MYCNHSLRLTLFTRFKLEQQEVEARRKDFFQSDIVFARTSFPEKRTIPISFPLCFISSFSPSLNTLNFPSLSPPPHSQPPHSK